MGAMQATEYASYADATKCDPFPPCLFPTLKEGSSLGDDIVKASSIEHISTYIIG